MRENDRQFNTLNPMNGLVSGEQARPLFIKSGLSPAILAQIWQLADYNKVSGCWPQFGGFLIESLIVLGNCFVCGFHVSLLEKMINLARKIFLLASFLYTGVSAQKSCKDDICLLKKVTNEMSVRKLYKIIK